VVRIVIFLRSYLGVASSQKFRRLIHRLASVGRACMHDIVDTMHNSLVKDFSNRGREHCWMGDDTVTRQGNLRHPERVNVAPPRQSFALISWMHQMRIN